MTFYIPVLLTLIASHERKTKARKASSLSLPIVTEDKEYDIPMINGQGVSEKIFLLDQIKYSL